MKDTDILAYINIPRVPLSYYDLLHCKALEYQLSNKVLGFRIAISCVSCVVKEETKFVAIQLCYEMKTKIFWHLKQNFSN